MGAVLVSSRGHACCYSTPPFPFPFDYFFGGVAWGARILVNIFFCSRTAMELYGDEPGRSPSWTVATRAVRPGLRCPGKVSLATSSAVHYLKTSSTITLTQFIKRLFFIWKCCDRHLTGAEREVVNICRLEKDNCHRKLVCQSYANCTYSYKQHFQGQVSLTLTMKAVMLFLCRHKLLKVSAARHSRKRHISNLKHKWFRLSLNGVPVAQFRHYK